MNLSDVLKFSIDLLAVLLLALGIKGLSKVRSARDANRLAAVAMMLAVIGVLVDSYGSSSISIGAWIWIIFGSVVGGLLGMVTAKRVAMTAMPETVALFNGCGGMSSLLVALAAAMFPLSNSTGVDGNGLVEIISIIISVFVGSITFTGSIVAMAKLQGWLSTPTWMQSNLRHLINIGLAVLAFVSIVSLLNSGNNGLWLLVISSGLLGIGVTLSIGGADMPVVISLLNSYSGVAAAAAGFVVKSQLLIVAGAMVGAAGLILTQVMCNGMNRSLLSVLFGGAIGATSTSGSGSTEYINITSCSVEECALTLEAAERVVIVPGYGLAVAQAQHTLREVTRALESNGINVIYAIHPVAGRMPGHMNVLLAEADVPYEQLKEMDVVNPEFPATDVVLVLGANDVVNPQAKNDPSSPLYGMPVLDVQEARTVFVIKRGMSAGYSGIKNDLFDLSNTSMVFGDAKKVLGDLLVELKELGISGNS
ncbi:MULTISPECIES: NAD(P)(+) transhydrogenase (Re/Si-specific) subunit beta [unclassified Prochlorococcus]|uniref:NAD(P)(+) transhydrogenase (Re/Si-specific) subunit beta n=1 Tax=unclassified Prochlorococcus TaxID=2627481 RepID=UPI000533B598|nr:MULTISPECIES: NAD(P)(+) transhydrogenase (Re/Si-specific) subunit beta [unclassified Prochlorococcus]KGG15558.1 NAD(P) transhydrogenase subunit beta [Prochlorococcus sp. MIT 0602]KGG17838.1 NAD(P) transhydrogenase subunit beta [Prochlorococcus sp. MIT 0603]